MSGNLTGYNYDDLEKRFRVTLDNIINAVKARNYAPVKGYAFDPISHCKNSQEQEQILLDFIAYVKLRYPAPTAISSGLSILRSGKGVPFNPFRNIPDFVLITGDAIVKGGEIGAKALLQNILGNEAEAKKIIDTGVASSITSQDSTASISTSEPNSRQSSFTTEDQPKPILFNASEDPEAPEHPSEGFEDAIESQKELNALNKKEKEEEEQVPKAPAPAPAPAPKKRRSFLRRN